jgi:hypothetical protein
MDSLLDRVNRLDGARFVALTGALLMAILAGAWIVSAVTGHWQRGGLLAALAASLIAAIGLLYAFRLGTPSASQ